ncbi:asparaginase domain-containing protein [Actinomyces vulturis]|uniref:asparaginase domain-containing protein n=1 Tax=Actinomyces vulturis TaxID=1857645 RepID=UPI000837A8FB|nr:asparaginase domain-containing protein [Actinomyces vulturis]
MHVHVLYTGGTIGMIDSPRGLIPGADIASWLNKLLASAHTTVSASRDVPPLPASVTFSALDPVIDSSNADADSWQQIITALNTDASSADAVVVLHGTDTLAYTASVLAVAGERGALTSNAPIVLTGSQRPALAKNSDAATNVLGSLCASALLASRYQENLENTVPVAIFFDDVLLAGCATTKISSFDDHGFASPNREVLARVKSDGSWTISPDFSCGTGLNWGALPSFAQSRAIVGALPLRPCDLVTVEITPGLSADRLIAACSPHPDALIVRAFGAGNVPSTEGSAGAACATLASRGVPVIVTSACVQGEVSFGHYETSNVLVQAGALSAGSMTGELCVALLHWLLSQGLDKQALVHAWGLLTA